MYNLLSLGHNFQTTNVRRLTNGSKDVEFQFTSFLQKKETKRLPLEVEA